MDKIQVFPQLCTKVKLARSACRECLSACPAHAIEFGERSLSITSSCTGCECCVAACPNEVFSLVTEGEDTPLSGPAPCSFYCSKLVPGRVDLAGSLGNGIVPCIGSLPLHSLLNRVTQAKEPVKVFTADCGRCEMKAAFLNFEKKREGVLSPLLLLKIPITSLLVQRGTEQDRKEAGKRYLACKTRQEENSGLRRRDFLMSLRQPASLGKRSKKPGEMGKESAERNGKRLPVWIGALTTLFKNNRGNLTGNEKVAFFPGMEIDETCSGCEVCASLCPTGALRGKITEGKFQLEWTPSHCSGCHLCEEVCPERVIRSCPGLPVRNLCEETSFILKAFYQYHCPECLQEYRSRYSDTPCPHCQKQKDLLEDYSRILYGETEKTLVRND